jgi:hypothetical protein
VTESLEFRAASNLFFAGRMQFNYFCSQFSFLDFQFSWADWQVESSWTGASWIDVEHSVFLFYLGLVAVAVDYGGYAGCFGLEV